MPILTLQLRIIIQLRGKGCLLPMTMHHATPSQALSPQCLTSMSGSNSGTWYPEWHLHPTVGTEAQAQDPGRPPQTLVCLAGCVCYGIVNSSLATLTSLTGSR